MTMPQDKRRSQPAPRTNQDAVTDAIAIGRKLIADIDDALNAGRRLFEAHGLDYRAVAIGIKRLHGPAGADRLQQECANVMASIDGSDLHRLQRFDVKPAADGKSRRPRNLI